MAPKGSTGIVIEDLGEQVKVCLVRRHGCHNCALRGQCRLPEGDSGFLSFLFGGKPIEIVAHNEAGAQVGDECLVQLKDNLSVIKGSFVLYLIPGMLFIIGLVLGGLLGGGLLHLKGDAKVLAQLAGGLLLLLLGFAAAALYGRRRRREFTPVVVAVVKRAGPDQAGHRHAPAPPPRP